MRKEIRGTVPSLRLDALAGLGFGCSRSRAAQYIKEGLIAVQGSVQKNAAKTMDKGEEITLEGRGSCFLKEVEGESKKGRLKVVMQRLDKEEE